MGTIAKLVIDVGADPRGVKTGLGQATSYIKDFKRAAENALATVGRGNKGSQLADSIIGNLQDRLVASSDKIREQLFRGLLNPQAAATASRRAAEAMNSTILSTLGDLRTKGLATPEIEHMLVSQLQTAGLKGGQALATGMRSATPEVEAATANWGGVAGRSFASAMTATIHRHRALIPTIAGLVLSQALSSAGDVANAESKIIETAKAAEKIIENFAMLASFLLPPIPGLISAVVGGSIAAIIKMFVHAKEQMHEFTKSVKKELDGLINSVDQLGLEQRLKIIEKGQPSGGRSKAAKGAFAFEVDEKGFFKSGLNDLLSLQRNDRFALQFNSTAQSRTLAGRKLIEQAIAAREPLIKQAQEQQARIRDALLNPLGGETGFGGQLPAKKIAVAGPAAAFDVLEKQLRQIEQTHEALKNLGYSIKPILAPAADVWRSASTALYAHNIELRKTGKLYDDTSLHLEEIRARAMELATIGISRDTLPGVQRSRTLHEIVADLPSPWMEKGLPGVRYLQPAQMLPQPKQLPASDKTLNELRLRAVVATLQDGLASVGTRLKEFAGATFWGIVRSIAGQLNPFSQVITGINAAAKPLVGFMTKLANIVANILGPVFEAFAPVLESLLPLFDALTRVLSPILRALAPVFAAFVPILNALFPIFKYGAIVATYLFQAFAIGAAVFTRAVGVIIIGWGTIIKALATAIDKLPFVSAKGAINAAQGIIDFGRGLIGASDEFLKSAEEMAKARDEIRGINIDPTKTAIDALGDAASTAAAALLNVPVGYKVALARFRTQDYAPGFGPLGTSQGPLGGGGGGKGYPSVSGAGSNSSFNFAPGSIVIPGTDMTARELFDEFLEEAQRRARSQLGDPKRWSEVQV